MNAIIDINTIYNRIYIELLKEPKWSMFSEFIKYGKRLLFFECGEVPEQEVLYKFEPEKLLLSTKITDNLEIRDRSLILKPFFISWYCLKGGVNKRDFRSFQNCTFELKELYDAGKLDIRLIIDGEPVNPIVKPMKERIGTIEEKIKAVKNESHLKRTGCPRGTKDKTKRILPGWIYPCCVCSQEERRLFTW